MSRCEDYPCCGHELGCCPDFDEAGRQLNIVCICGAKLPVTSRFSICDGCMDRDDEDFPESMADDGLDEEEADWEEKGCPSAPAFDEVTHG